MILKKESLGVERHMILRNQSIYIANQCQFFYYSYLIILYQYIIQKLVLMDIENITDFIENQNCECEEEEIQEVYLAFLESIQKGLENLKQKLKDNGLSNSECQVIKQKFCRKRFYKDFVQYLNVPPDEILKKEKQLLLKFSYELKKKLDDMDIYVKKNQIDKIVEELKNKKQETLRKILVKQKVKETDIKKFFKDEMFIAFHDNIFQLQIERTRFEESKVSIGDEIYENQKIALAEFMDDYQEINFDCAQKCLYRIIIYAYLLKYQVLYTQKYKNEFPNINEAEFNENILKLEAEIIKEGRHTEQIRTAILKIKNQKDKIGSLIMIKKQLHSLDVNDLARLIKKTKATEDIIYNKSIYLFIGQTGAGKTTTILSFLGNKMVTKQLKGMKWITPEKPVSDPQEKLLITSPEQKSITRYILCIQNRSLIPSNETIFFCDSPGFGDSAGAEVDIANAVGMVNAIRKCYQLKPIIIFGIQTWGKRGQNMKNLLKLLGQMFQKYDIENKLTYIFTKHTQDQFKQINSRLINLEQLLTSSDKQNNKFVEILRDLIEETKKIQNIITFDPIKDDYKKILKKILEKKYIRETDDFTITFSDRSISILKQQCKNLRKIIQAQFEKNNIEAIKYFLDKFLTLKDLFGSKITEEQFTQIQKYLQNKIVQKQNEIKNQFKRKMGYLMVNASDLDILKANIQNFEQYEKVLNYKSSLLICVNQEVQNLIDKIINSENFNLIKGIEVIKQINQKFKIQKIQNLTQFLANQFNENFEKYKQCLENKSLNDAIKYLINVLKYNQVEAIYKNQIPEKNALKLKKIYMILPDLIKSYIDREDNKLIIIREQKCRAIEQNSLYLQQISICYKLINLHNQQHQKLIIEGIKKFEENLTTKIDSKLENIISKFEETNCEIKEFDIRELENNISNMKKLFLITFIKNKFEEKFVFSIEKLNRYLHSQQDNLQALCEAVQKQVDTKAIKRGLRELKKALDGIKKLSGFGSQNLKKSGQQIYQETIDILKNYLKDMLNKVENITINLKIQKNSELESLMKIEEEILCFKEFKSDYLDGELIKQIENKSNEKFDRLIKEIEEMLTKFKQEKQNKNKNKRYENFWLVKTQKILCFLEQSKEFVKNSKINSFLEQFQTEFSEYRELIFEVIKQQLVNLDKNGSIDEKDKIFFIIKKKIWQLNQIFTTYPKIQSYMFDNKHEYRQSIISILEKYFHQYDTLWKKQKNTLSKKSIEKLLQNCKYFGMVSNIFISKQEPQSRAFNDLYKKIDDATETNEEKFFKNIQQNIKNQNFCVIQEQIEKLKQDKKNGKTDYYEYTMTQLQAKCKQMIRQINAMKQAQFLQKQGQNLKIEIFNKLDKLNEVHNILHQMDQKSLINNSIVNIIQDLQKFIVQTIEERKELIFEKISNYCLQQALNEMKSFRKIEAIIQVVKSNRTLNSNIMCKHSQNLETSLKKKEQELVNFYQNLQTINYQSLNNYKKAFSEKSTISRFRQVKEKIDNYIIIFFEKQFQSYIREENLTEQEQIKKKIKRSLQYTPLHLKANLQEKFNEKVIEKDHEKQNVNTQIQERLKNNPTHDQIINILQQIKKKSNIVLNKKIKELIANKIQKEQIGYQFQKISLSEILEKLKNFYSIIQKYKAKNSQNMIRDFQVNTLKKLNNLFNEKLEKNRKDILQLIYLKQNQVIKKKDQSTINKKQLMRSFIQCKNFFNQNKEEANYKNMGQKFQKQFCQIKKQIQSFCRSLYKMLDINQIIEKATNDESIKFTSNLNKIKQFEQIFADIFSGNQIKKTQYFIDQFIKNYQQQFKYEPMLKSIDTDLKKTCEYIDNWCKKFKFLQVFEKLYQNFGNQNAKLLKTNFQNKFKQFIQKHCLILSNVNNKSIKQLENLQNRWKAINYIKQKDINHEINTLITNLQSKIKQQMIQKHKPLLDLVRNSWSNQNAKKKINQQKINAKKPIQNKFIKDCVEFILKFNFLIRFIPLDEKTINSFIVECKSKIKTDHFFKLMVHEMKLSDCKIAAAVIESQSFIKYKGKKQKSNNIKFIPVNDTLNYNIQYRPQLTKEKMNSNQKKLEKCFEQYSRHINLLYQKKNENNTLVQEIMKEIQNYIKEIQKKQNNISKIKKNNIEQQEMFLLVNIFALFTVLKQDKTDNDIQYYKSPTKTQLISIFYLLGLYSDKQTIDMRRIVSINKSKDLCIGIMAAYLALLDYQVVICCSSEYNKLRFKKEFRGLYQKLTVENSIQFNSLKTNCENILKRRDARINEIIQTITGQKKQKKQKLGMQKKQILIIDELDQIFDQDFMLNYFEGFQKIENQEINKYFQNIWTEKSKMFAAYENLKQIDPYKYRMRIKEKMQQVCLNLKYNQELDHIIVNQHYCYATQFHERFKTKIIYQNFLSFKIAKIMYTELIKYYKRIFAFTSHYEIYNQTEQNFLENDLKFEEICTISKNNHLNISAMIFSPGIKVEKKDNFQTKILTKIKETINKNLSILVLVENENIGQKITTSLLQNSSQYHKVYFLTDPSKNKQNQLQLCDIIDTRTILVLTKKLIKGRRFSLSEQLNNNGGIHILQTYLSSNRLQKYHIQQLINEQNYSMELVLQESQLQLYNIPEDRVKDIHKIYQNAIEFENKEKFNIFKTKFTHYMTHYKNYNQITNNLLNLNIYYDNVSYYNKSIDSILQDLNPVSFVDKDYSRFVIVIDSNMLKFMNEFMFYLPDIFAKVNEKKYNDFLIKFIVLKQQNETDTIEYSQFTNNCDQLFHFLKSVKIEKPNQKYFKKLLFDYLKQLESKFNVIMISNNQDKISRENQKDAEYKEIRNSKDITFHLCSINSEKNQNGWQKLMNGQKYNMTTFRDYDKVVTFITNVMIKRLNNFVQNIFKINLAPSQ